MIEDTGVEASAWGTELEDPEAVFVNLSSPQEILLSEGQCVQPTKDRVVSEDAMGHSLLCAV